MRNKTESVAGLMEGIQRAAEQKEFNILQDLQMLQTAYPKTSKRDYLQLLKKLVEKYSVDEEAEVHAALLRKCRAGDVEAIRLYGQMRQKSGGEFQEVTIVDSI